MGNILVLGGTRNDSLGSHLAVLGLEKGHSAMAIGRTPIGPDHATPLDYGAPGVHYYRLDLSSPVACYYDMRDNFLAGDSSDTHVSHLVLAAGVHLQGRVTDQAMEDILYQDLLAYGQIAVLKAIMEGRRTPLTLIAVGSTTVKADRVDETAYKTGKTTLATFVTSFYHELVALAPGSRSLIVHPGGMRTKFLKNSAIPPEDLMDPAEVASIIWNKLGGVGANQLAELVIPRPKPGNPIAPEFSVLKR